MTNKIKMGEFKNNISAAIASKFVKAFNVCSDSFINSFIWQVTNSNKSIGEITNMNNATVAILNELEAAVSDEEVAEAIRIAQHAVIHAVDGAGTGKGDYQSLPAIIDYETNMYIVQMNKIAAEEHIINGLMTCNLKDIDNLIRIFRDLNRLYRVYQELTIDAAKKGMEVEIVIPISTIWPKSLTSLQHNFDSFNSEFKITRRERKLSDDVEKDEVIVIEDPIAKLQDEYLSIAEDFVNNMLKPAFDNVGFDNDDLAQFEQFSFLDEDNTLFKDLTQTVKYIYSDCARDYAEQVNSISEEDKAQREELKKNFDDETGMLANLSRQLLKDYSPADGGRIMKLAAMTGKDGANPHSTNQIAMICPEKFMAMILEDYAEVKVCGYPIMSGAKHVQVGDVLNFENGCAVTEEGKTVMVKSSYTGELTVHDQDGKLYVVKPIENAIVEPDMNKAVFAVRKAYDPRSGGRGEYADLLGVLGHKDIVNVSLSPRGSVMGKAERDLIHATVTTKSGKEATVCVGRYKCESKVMTDLLNGVIGTPSKIVYKHPKRADGSVRNTVLVELDVTGREAIDVSNRPTDSRRQVFKNVDLEDLETQATAEVVEDDGI